MAEPAEAKAAKKILVVDDEADVRVYLSRLLRENGFEVATACGAEEAAAAVASDPPGLITLDISMPDTSGARFYRELKSQPGTAGIRVVFVTGVTGPGGAADTERFYATRRQVPPPDGFIAKPIDPDEMLEMIRKLV